MKIYIRFLQSNHQCFQTRLQNDFGISGKPFREQPCLNWYVLLLSFPTIYLWYYAEFYWSLTHLRITHNNEGDFNLGN